MNSRRSNQRRPVRRSSNSTEFDGRPDRASRNGAYTRRDSFDPSAYGRSSDSSRTPSPRSTHDDNPYTRRVSQAEYTQRRKRAKRKRIALVAVAVVLVLCLGGAGAAFAYYQTVSNNLHQGIDDDLARTLAAAEAAHPYEGGPFYMLLMGTDGSSDREASAEYAGDQFRSDSMMVTRIDPQGKKVALVSLHRDTLVDMGEYGQQKLNAAHSIGGASYTVETVSKLAGVPITHYAEINFDGFEDVVDALGGVEVDVPMEINDDEAGGHVDAGEQTLSGEEALILCRSRHSYDEYGDGDRYRAANQRLVLGAIAKKILSADPATMANTISALSQYITTDFKVGDIVALATSMQGIDPSKDIYSAMEPTISEYKNDTWYEQLDVAAWNTMMGRVREGLPPTEVDEVDELNGTVLASVGDGKAAASDSEGVQGVNGTQRQTFGETRTGIVTIKNGNGINGVGAEALERIKPLGYTADASNANSFSYEETVVVFDTPDQRVYAEELIDALGCGRAVQNTDGEYVYDGDFLILIGSDWH